ncbi:MAG: hypothetical protein ACJ8OJ_16625 [Povalibacter sp.]
MSSCGGGGGSNTGPTSAPSSVSNDRPISQSNLEIAQTLYSGTPRTPTGFFKDEILADQIQTTVHLKNTDIDDSLAAPMPQYELCTDDWNQALDWSESHAAQASQYADLVDTKTTADFFEFDRFRTGTPETYVRERVFKCTYVDRSTADLRSPQGSAGHLNRRPLTAAELQSLVEYLWQFTSYNNFGHAVLQSSASKDSLSHTLFIANLTRAGVSASCDRVEVIAWRHTANANGELNLDIEALFSFGARESAGVTSLCSG